MINCANSTENSMLARNKIKLNYKQVHRESFDRFDDNLVENILSYLTFTEKVMFESVSKRFERLVYKKQKQLSLRRWESEDNHCVNWILEPIEVIDYNTASAVAYGLKRINKFWLNLLLKKCQSIESIVLDCFVDFEDMNMICKYCPKLKILELNTTGLSADDLDNLGKRYGQRFHKIQFNSSCLSSKYWNNFLIHCKNLKEFVTRDFHQLFINDQAYLPKLEIINYSILPEAGGKLEQFEKYDQFCEKFKQTITKLTVSVFTEMKTQEIIPFFNSTCKLKNMQNLECFLFNIQENDHGIDKYILELAKNMPNLKRLRLSIYSLSLKVDQFFNSFKEFKNLIDFDVYICGYNENKSFNGSLECFKSLKNLRFLRISVESIGEEFFEGIDKHLPNLSELTIECETEITDKTLLQLSHLKKLKKFNLFKYKDNCRSITDESVCAVINGCPSLESLCFSSRPNITNKTIEALINCANSYPKRSLRFECGLAQEEGEEDNEDQIPALDIKRFVSKIPKNLTIDYMATINE